MVTRYGMSEDLGHVVLEKDQRSFLSPNPLLAGLRERDFSDQTATAIDRQVRWILEQAFDRAVAILTRRRNALERAARRLLEKETLTEKEIRELFAIGEIGVVAE
jgi:cell division protease FtsH